MSNVFAANVWILASEMLSGYVRHCVPYTEMAIVTFYDEDELRKLYRAKKLLTYLKGASITISINCAVLDDIDDMTLSDVKSTVMFISESDFPETMKPVAEKLSEVPEKSYVPIETALISTIRPCSVLKGYLYAVVSEYGVVFELFDEVTTSEISWDDIPEPEPIADEQSTSYDMFLEAEHKFDARETYNDDEEWIDEMHYSFMALEDKLLAEEESGGKDVKDE